MNVAILGFSVLDQSENLPLYRYFKARGDTITAFYWGGDTVKNAMPDDITKIAVADANVEFPDLDKFDMIVRSPIVHPRQIKTSKPVTTLTNIFMEHCPAPVLGVTGTKGKGTTSTLVAKILEAAGKTVILGGNIGTPLLDSLPTITPDMWVVYEMSNFQLVDVRRSPQVAVCLMVVPEHLDWHADAAEYFAAKSGIFTYQTPSDTAVFNYNNQVSSQLASASPAGKITYDVPPANSQPNKTDGAYVAGDTIYMRDTAICKIHEVALLGRHNLENICAAIAATWDIIEGNLQAITSVITTFSGLEHRLEFVRKVHGVSYYNDSFSTTPETAIAAIKAFDQPKILIAGGYDKGIPFDELARTIAEENVKHVVTIGTTSDAISTLIKSHSAVRPVEITNFGAAAKPSMDEIVSVCQAQAAPGDIVLLSTGCASYGMFQNYKERGKAFKAAVQNLT